MICGVWCVANDLQTADVRVCEFGPTYTGEVETENRGEEEQDETQTTPNKCMETLLFSFFIFPLAASGLSGPLLWDVADGLAPHRPLLALARREQQDVEVSHLGF